MKFVNNEFRNDENEIKELDRLQSELAANAKPVEPEKPKIIEPTRSREKLGKVNRIANMRVTPNPTADILDVVIIGTKVNILGTDRNYYKVSYNSNTGYILKNCVDEIW